MFQLKIYICLPILARSNAYIQGYYQGCDELVSKKRNLSDTWFPLHVIRIRICSSYASIHTYIRQLSGFVSLGLRMIHVLSLLSTLYSFLCHLTTFSYQTGKAGVGYLSGALLWQGHYERTLIKYDGHFLSPQHGPFCANHHFLCSDRYSRIFVLSVERSAPENPLFLLS